MPQESRRWSIKTTSEVRDWLRTLRQADPDVYRSVNVAIDVLAETAIPLAESAYARWVAEERKRREEDS
jgi:hypothetical protein